jgi:hypothetical protein
VSFDRDQPVVFGLRFRVRSEDRRLRWAVYIGIDQPDLLAKFRECHGKIRSHG